MVQITQDSFTYSTRHIDMVVDLATDLSSNIVRQAKFILCHSILNKLQ